ncbi:MAG: sigma-70 family RNA polymerase sigma factor [Spirochaetes bacterium]|nr:sigma-70 family RNA polymerase sigma factor [Spirochaetota bacterium]
MSPHPHDALAVRASKGDRDAFGELYDHYFEPIRRFVAWHGGKPDRVEDIVSQAFLQALDRITAYDPAKGPFPAWLYTIARHCVIDQFRREKKTVFSDLSLVPDAREAEGEPVPEERLAQMRTLLAELKPQQREVVLLRVWEDKSYEEIAAIVGRSADACKMSFSRSLALLRDRMPPVALFLAFCLEGLRSLA